MRIKGAITGLLVVVAGMAAVGWGQVTLGPTDAAYTISSSGTTITLSVPGKTGTVSIDNLKFSEYLMALCMSYSNGNHTVLNPTNNNVVTSRWDKGITINTSTDPTILSSVQITFLSSSLTYADRQYTCHNIQSITITNVNKSGKIYPTISIKYYVGGGSGSNPTLTTVPFDFSELTPIQGDYLIATICKVVTNNRTEVNTIGPNMGGNVAVLAVPVYMVFNSTNHTWSVLTANYQTIAPWPSNQ